MNSSWHIVAQKSVICRFFLLHLLVLSRFPTEKMSAHVGKVIYFLRLFMWSIYNLIDIANLGLHECIRIILFHVLFISVAEMFLYILNAYNFSISRTQYGNTTLNDYSTFVLLLYFFQWQWAMFKKSLKLSTIVSPLTKKTDRSRIDLHCPFLLSYFVSVPRDLR